MAPRETIAHQLTGIAVRLPGVTVTPDPAPVSHDWLVGSDGVLRIRRNTPENAPSPRDGDTR
jgi:hypothetical protein